MKNFNNLLVLGATNRNLGKTEFICRLIKRFSTESIVAIKVKTFYPGDANFHGKGSGFSGDYLVRKETVDAGLDDSRRFISAGATAVYYVKSRIEKLEIAIEEVRSNFSETQLFVAESNSVLQYYKPGGFIMIKGPDKFLYKPSSIQFMNRAEMCIDSDGEKFNPDPLSLDIKVTKAGWLLKPFIITPVS